MSYSKSKDRWVSVGIIAICLAPVAIILTYAIILIHFLVKFW